jgi:hydroxymethylbilane synthase
MKFTFATRPSALARWQTSWVRQRLQSVWPDLECEEQVITTRGDRILDRPLPQIGGKGLFTQELENELLAGRVQAAVHSLKDLPVLDPPGLIVGAIPERADARDVLIAARGYTIDSLPEGARVGTSSLRRSAQLLAIRPDLRIESLRGNVDTRVRKALAGEYDAIVLAGAGLLRLGLESAVSQWLPLEVMLPAPGQGALAVQCRQEDADTLALLAAVDHHPSRRAAEAERCFLQFLGGGCSLPVGASAVQSEAGITLIGLAASPDGKRIVRLTASGQEPQQVGRALAEQMMAQGAGEFLYA